MIRLDIENYISERLEPQIKWYDEKSISCNKNYKRLSIATLILTALIPVLVVFADFFPILIKILIALSGSAATVIGGIISLCKYQDLWIKYRNTCETLKKELYLFRTQSGCYTNCKISETIFISNCENIISSENDYWLDVYKDCSSSTSS